VSLFHISSSSLPGHARTSLSTLPVRATAALLAAVIASLAGALPAATAHGGAVRDRQYWLDDYGITDAWETTQGDGVKVAVIDSGVDASHPDLAGAVVGGTDVSGVGHADGRKGVGEIPEHGTLVATLLAGRGHEAKKGPSPAATDSPAGGSGEQPQGGPDGIIGVAPKAEILAVSAWVGGENPAGISIDEQIPYAVRWAVDNGAQVINMSLGSTSTSWPESWDDAFLYAELNDVVVVAAAGNRAGGLSQVGAPATIPGVLAVGGLSRDGEASWDSSSEGISLGVAAPAEKLVGGLPGGGYANWSGTSGAAPLVAGVAALIRSRYPDLSAAQVVNRIILTARDAGAPGQDTLYGYGILDAGAAVNADIAVPAENVLGSIENYIKLYRRSDVQPPGPARPARSAEAAPAIPEPTVPVAAAPAAASNGLPAAVVLGSGGLILVVLIMGATQVVRAARGEAGSSLRR
jgi:subtilisin family serine protease